MNLTNGKLVRPDQTEMPTDQNGLLTDVADARLVLHELTKDFANMMTTPVALPGMSVFDMLMMSNPLTGMLLVEAVNNIHDAACPHKGEVQFEDAGTSDVDNLMSEILGIIRSIPETPEQEKYGHDLPDFSNYGELLDGKEGK